MTRYVRMAYTSRVRNTVHARAAHSNPKELDFFAESQLELELEKSLS